MNRYLLIAMVFVALLSKPALADPACLQFGQIYSWKAIDNRTLIVEDNWHNKFKVSLMGYCPNLTFKERVGFKSPGSTALSCMGKGDEVIVRDISMPSRCPIVNITPYTAAMEKADKDAAAAKAMQHGTH